MTGAVVPATLFGVAGLLAGVALWWYLRRTNDWYLRRTNDWCPHCGDQLSCQGCGSRAAWPRPRVSERAG